MPSRLELQMLLEELLESRNVYFQPPSDLVMQYPAIRYTLDTRPTDYADDISYIRRLKYSLIVIDKNPDSSIPSKILDIPTAAHTRRYTSNNLNHDVFTLYF